MSKKVIKINIVPDLNTQVLFSKDHNVTYNSASYESSGMRAGKVYIRMCDGTKVALNYQRMGKASHQVQTEHLTLILLTWTIWRPPTNASKWRMGFNPYPANVDNMASSYQC